MWGFNGLKDLCIYKSRYFNILTCNTSLESNDLEIVQETKIALNEKECEKLLKIKSLDIEILKVQGDIEDDNLNVEYLKFNIKSFNNLKKLILYQMAVTDEDLQIIGQNCAQLRSLQLIKCFCEHFRAIVPGVNINNEIICNMVQLEQLRIQPHKPPKTNCELKLEYVQQLLNRLIKLKSLKLNNFTIVCEASDKTNRSYLPLKMWSSLEILNAGIITLDFWCTFTGFLKCCPQLRQLTINVDKDSNAVLNIKIIDILSKYCTNLQILKLENCEINVEDFCPLQRLQDLTLNSCRGLSFNNLQQILGGLKLNNFTLIDTRVFDANNYIYASHTLQSITIKTEHFTEISEMFQRSLNNFTGLQTLNWYNGDINHNWIVDKCPHLQQLHIAHPYHLPRFVFKMQTLKELTITSCNGVSWSLLKMLLFSLSLKSLNILSNGFIIGNEINSQNSLKMHTTLESIIIPYEIFLKGLNYWLDLVDVNEHLRLLIFGKAENILNVRLICLLLAVDCVRKRSKRFKICGFNLELEDFGNEKILREIARLHINTNHYKTRKMPFTLEL